MNDISIAAGAVVLAPDMNRIRAQAKKQTDDDTFRQIIADFDRAWESQRAAEGVSDAEAVKKSLAAFTRGADFSLVIDGKYYATFQEWADHVAVSLPATRRAEHEAHHETLSLRITRFSSRAAAVTQVYRYSFIETDGKRGTQTSAATFVFRRRKGTWEIVQYHGSHGRPIYEGEKDQKQ